MIWNPRYLVGIWLLHQVRAVSNSEGSTEKINRVRNVYIRFMVSTQ